jgi:hypothetical protein
MPTTRAEKCTRLKVVPFKVAHDASSIRDRHLSSGVVKDPSFRDNLIGMRNEELWQFVPVISYLFKFRIDVVEYDALT